MRRAHWFLACFVVLLLAEGGVAVVWALAHRGYPYAVEYRQAAIAYSASDPYPHDGTLVRQWFDPIRRNDRMIVTGNGAHYDLLIHAGDYVVQGRAARLPMRLAAYLAWGFHEFAQGCGADDGVNPPVPAKPVGSVTHVKDLYAIMRCEREQRLAPYTLPADFFEPPHAQHALWDRLTGWLAAHLPHR